MQIERVDGQSDSNDWRRKIYVRPEDVERRLLSLGGLSQAVILDSVRAGLLARLECTENDPLTAPGFSSWMRTVRRLRERVIELGTGWARSNSANQGLVVNEHLGLTLNVAGGNAWTGILGQNPSTRSRKGLSLASAVQSNSLWLFPSMKPQAPSDGRGTWLLLAFWDVKKQCVQLELSRPVGFEAERPIDWSERILLPNIPTDEPSMTVGITSGGFDKTPEIDVEVRRRA